MGSLGYKANVTWNAYAINDHRVVENVNNCIFSIYWGCLLQRTYFLLRMALEIKMRVLFMFATGKHLQTITGKLQNIFSFGYFFLSTKSIMFTYTHIIQKYIPLYWIIVFCIKIEGNKVFFQNVYCQINMFLHIL